jgi:hypothetical protein
VPLVVNAGPGHVFGPGAGVAARATAAHSTVEIDGAPSARLCRPGLAARAYGGWLEEGPSLVSVRQAQDHTGQWLLATHDGYVETHGLLHERRLFVDSRGTECRGEEIVYVTDGRAQKRFDGIAKQRRRPVLMTARFHLHPDVAASVDPVRQVVELRPPGIDRSGCSAPPAGGSSSGFGGISIPRRRRRRRPADRGHRRGRRVSGPDQLVLHPCSAEAVPAPAGRAALRQRRRQAP